MAVQHRLAREPQRRAKANSSRSSASARPVKHSLQHRGQCCVSWLRLLLLPRALAPRLRWRLRDGQAQPRGEGRAIAVAALDNRLFQGASKVAAKRLAQVLRRAGVLRLGRS